MLSKPLLRTASTLQLRGGLATREGPQRWIAEPVWSIEEASAIEASHSVQAYEGAIHSFSDSTSDAMGISTGSESLLLRPVTTLLADSLKDRHFYID